MLGDLRRIDKINSLIDVSVPNDLIEFGSVTPGESYNTSDDTPLPFLLQNDGNCMLNISVNATSPFSSVNSESDYYKYKADNKSGEEGSFDWPQSITAWTQMPITSSQTAIADFNWSNSTDSAEVDLLFLIPLGESAEDKNTTVYFESSFNEVY